MSIEEDAAKVIEDKTASELRDAVEASSSMAISIAAFWKALRVSGMSRREATEITRIYSAIMLQHGVGHAEGNYSEG